MPRQSLSGKNPSLPPRDVLDEIFDIPIVGIIIGVPLVVLGAAAVVVYVFAILLPQLPIVAFSRSRHERRPTTTVSQHFAAGNSAVTRAARRIRAAVSRRKY